MDVDVTVEQGDEVLGPGGEPLSRRLRMVGVGERNHVEGTIVEFHFNLWRPNRLGS
jgi:hypothetical protein